MHCDLMELKHWLFIFQRFFNMCISNQTKLLKFNMIINHLYLLLFFVFYLKRYETLNIKASLYLSFDVKGYFLSAMEDYTILYISITMLISTFVVGIELFFGMYFFFVIIKLFLMVLEII